MDMNRYLQNCILSMQKMKIAYNNWGWGNACYENRLSVNHHHEYI